MTTIVFLHIPKTAGQTIHNALVSVVGGPDHVSPVRVHSQAPNGPQMPAGYKLYSGHIDWVELDTLPQDRFVFSVLRDPRERIASFYLYLLKEAQGLTAKQLALPQNTGKRRILENTADDYFFGGDQSWQNFVRDHYDNFYCTYFATRKMRGNRLVRDLSQVDLIARAQEGWKQLDGLYFVDNLGKLETDFSEKLGRNIEVTTTYHNIGNNALDKARWPIFLDRFEQDASVARLDAFVEADDALIAKIKAEA
ncbi:MAG: sulfotransferase family 2 domain-containing protein [Lentilitoribacter sp.]